jgi:hypothetical protein
VYDKLRRATKQRFKSSWNRKDAFNNLGRGLKRFGLILQRTRGYPHHSTWLQLDHNYIFLKRMNATIYMRGVLQGAHAVIN